jgi:predicted negative regulator of RcsB-dependent stress response
MQHPLLETETPYGLGTLVVRHRPAWRKQLVILMIFALITGVFALAKINDPQTWTWQLDATLLCFVGISLAIGIIVWRTWRRRFLVFEDGLVVRNGSATEIYRWNELKHFVHFVRRAQGTDTLSIVMGRRDGKELKINSTDLKEPDSGDVEMGDEVGVLPFLALVEPLALSKIGEDCLVRYRRGERLDFRKFQLSHEGIHVGTETLPWWMVDDINGDGNVLIIRERNHAKPRWTLWIAEVPNRDLVPMVLTETQGRVFSATSQPTEAMPMVEPILEIQNAYRRHGWRQMIAGVGVGLLLCGLQIGFAYYSDYNSPTNRLDRAIALADSGQPEAALVALNEVMPTTNEPTYALAWRCHVYRDLENFEAALADCRRALEIEPNDNLARVYLGKVYYRQLQYDSAIAEYEKVMAQDPDYGYAYCQRGYSYRKMGRVSDAIADFETCRNLMQDERWDELTTDLIAELRTMDEGEVPQ